MLLRTTEIGNSQKKTHHDVDLDKDGDENPIHVLPQQNMKQ